MIISGMLLLIDNILVWLCGELKEFLKTMLKCYEFKSTQSVVLTKLEGS